MPLVRANILLLLSLTPIIRADSWAAPTTQSYSSPSGQYGLIIDPAQRWRNPKDDKCIATVFEKVGSTTQPVWSRALINEVSPVSARISDDGYVITMDEWHQVGTLPVVIYNNADGRELARYTLESLGLTQDMEKIPRSVSSTWWNSEAIDVFLEEGKVWALRLKWGKVLWFDLPSGRLLDAAGDLPRVRALQEPTSTALAAEVMRLLNDPDRYNRSRGARAAKMLRVREAIGRLRELLNDDSWHHVTAGRGPRMTVYSVRIAAREALIALGEDPPEVLERQPDPR